MRWQGGRRSGNVQDRRGMPGRGLMIGGGGAGTVILLLIVLCMGGDPMALLQQIDQGQPGGGQPGAGQPGLVPPGQEEQVAFVEVVLADTEDVWREIFPREFGKPYQDPTLQLFTGKTESACGYANSAVGPFYCPRDTQVYIDLAFYDELAHRFNAEGDFAQAYVIAHEIGHHVQNQLGTMREFDQAAARMDERRRNAATVRLELQADCYAGVWAFYAAKRNLLEPGDVEEGMRAASAVGDDTIQKRTQGYTVPDAFTHGKAEQRVRWFKAGLQSGDPRVCNTFAAKAL